MSMQSPTARTRPSMRVAVITMTEPRSPPPPCFLICLIFNTSRATGLGFDLGLLGRGQGLRLHGGLGRGGGRGGRGRRLALLRGDGVAARAVDAIALGLDAERRALLEPVEGAHLRQV